MHATNNYMLAQTHRIYKRRSSTVTVLVMRAQRKTELTHSGDEHGQRLIIQV